MRQIAALSCAFMLSAAGAQATPELTEQSAVALEAKYTAVLSYGIEFLGQNAGNMFGADGYCFAQVSQLIQSGYDNGGVQRTYRLALKMRDEDDRIDAVRALVAAIEGQRGGVARAQLLFSHRKQCQDAKYSSKRAQALLTDLDEHLEALGEKMAIEVAMADSRAVDFGDANP